MKSATIIITVITAALAGGIVGYQLAPSPVPAGEKKESALVIRDETEHSASYLDRHTRISKFEGAYTAEAFILVDKDGNIRAALATSPRGEPELTFFEEPVYPPNTPKKIGNNHEN